MNPSPLGGFMEGIAGGVKDMTAIMGMGKKLKAEKEMHAAEMRLSMGFKFFDILKGNPEAQKNVLKEFVMPAFQHFSKQGSVKYSDSQITNLFRNLDLKNEKGKVFMDSAMNIFKRYEKGELNQKETLDVFDAAVGTYTGELTGRQEDYLKQKRAAHIAEGRKKDMEKLFAPMAKKGIKPEQPSPVMSAFTKGYGKEIAGGIGAATQAGVPMHQAAAMFPKKKTAAPPTTPMYTDKQLENGTVQKMQYNPKTKKHDIPFGKPKTAKDGHYFKLGNSYYQVVNGKSKIVQKGSVDEQSVMNAMREFGWSMMSEPDKIESVAMHKRILLGQGKSGRKGGNKERTDAAAAIAAGIDPEMVKAMYKKRTGKEY